MRLSIRAGSQAGRVVMARLSSRTCLNLVAVCLIAFGCGGVSTARSGGDQSDTLTVVGMERIMGEGFDGFANIRAVVPLSGGRIAVADGNDPVIRILQGDGTLLQSLGRKGQGPGGFEQLSNLWSTPGDTLVVHDSRLFRIQVGHPATGFTDAWSSSAVADSAPYSSPVGLMRGTTVVLQSLLPIRPADPPVVERLPQRLVLSRAGSTIAVLTGFAGPEVYRGRGSSLGRLAFSRITLYGVTDDEIHALDTAGDTVAVYGVDGGLRRKIFLDLPARLVTEEDISADRERRRKEAQQFVGVGLPEAFVQGRLDAVDQIPSADSMPTASALHVDEAGRLWIKRFRPQTEEEADGQLWIVFEGDGTPIGQFQLPGTLSVSKPSRGVIWTWGQDSLGVPFVQPWRVEELAGIQSGTPR